MGYPELQLHTHKNAMCHVRLGNIGRIKDNEQRFLVTGGAEHKV